MIFANHCATGVVWPPSNIFQSEMEKLKKKKIKLIFAIKIYSFPLHNFLGVNSLKTSQNCKFLTTLFLISCALHTSFKIIPIGKAHLLSCISYQVHGTISTASKKEVIPLFMTKLFLFAMVCLLKIFQQDIK